MKIRPLLALALVACLAANGRSVRADDYVLEESHTSVIFGISHMGFSYTYGRFNQVKGAYTLDADPANCKFALQIEAASIDTNNEGRDKHLRGPDFLSTDEFPVISFTSAKVAARQDGDKTVYDVAGTMSMHGVEKEITLALVKLKEGEGFGGDYRSGFVCDTVLKRSDFGMTNMIPGVGDEVRIMISFEGIRQ